MRGSQVINCPLRGHLLLEQCRGDCRYVNPFYSFLRVKVQRGVKVTANVGHYDGAKRVGGGSGRSRQLGSGALSATPLLTDGVIVGFGPPLLWASVSNSGTESAS